MKRIKGFTVIELVVAVTIVCLLVAVAVASYQDHMTRKSRTQARKALVELAEWLQLQRSTSGTYLVKLPITHAPADGEAEYRIGMVAVPVNSTNPKILFPGSSVDFYTLQAVPLNPDPCGILLLDSSGRTGVTGASAQLADCWK